MVPARLRRYAPALAGALALALLALLGLIAAAPWSGQGRAATEALRSCQREAPATPLRSEIPAGGLSAGFERGLVKWNTAGVGDVVPTVDRGLARRGLRSARFLLRGSQGRSELILGGDGGRSAKRTIYFEEGDDFRFAFSFHLRTLTYGRPGAHNLIFQFKGADRCSPNFGLQLWSYRGGPGQRGRGLWSHGRGMGGDRFLAPAGRHRWHDVVIRMRASERGGGFYRLYLDGRLVDSRRGVSTIVPGSVHAYIKVGLYRNGDEIPGRSELRIDAVRLTPCGSPPNRRPGPPERYRGTGIRGCSSAG